MHGLTKELAALVVSLTYKQLSEEEVEKVKVCILNGIAVSLAAVDPSFQDIMLSVQNTRPERNSAIPVPLCLSI